MAEIDERVVAMRFDNKQFEAGVAESMSTLDKLKAKLNFSGAAKGFENLEKSANNVTLSGLQKSADAVEVKFSTMSIVAITAIERIVNSAMDAGTKMVKALSVDQLTAGFSKLEEMTRSTRTIMSATGLSIEEVQKQMDKLNWFTDETSYSLTDMTSNIGKFVANKIPLEESVTAMQGIALWAAQSGQGINEASRAMYNLSQAMGVGALKLVDWKSIENANMGTAEFKETAMEAAVAVGTLTKANGKYYTSLKKTEVTVENFRETLNENWLNKNTLMKTLNEYGKFTDEVYKIWSDNAGAIQTSEIIEQLGDRANELGYKALKAGQEYRTFSDAVAATKDAVSSGWMKSFELILGNAQEIVDVWTAVGEALWDIFASSAAARNEMLKEWKAQGGRDILLEGIGQAWKNLYSIIEVVREALNNVFPPMTAEKFLAFSETVRDFAKSFELSEESLNTLEAVIEVILTPLKIFTDGLKIAGIWTGTLIQMLFKLGDAFLASFSGGKQFENFLRNTIGDERYERIASALSTIFEKIGLQLGIISDKIRLIFSRFKESGQTASFLENLKNVLFTIGDIILDAIVIGLETLANMDWSWLSNLATGFGKFIGSLDLGKIALIGIMAVIVKFGSMVFGLTRGIGWATEAITGFFGNIADIMVAARWALLGTAVTLIVTSIAAIVVTLNNMNLDGLGWKVAALTVVMTELAAMTIIMNKIATNRRVALTSALFIASLSVSLGVIFIALNALKTEGILTKIGVLTLVVAEMALMGVIMSKSSISKKEKQTSAPFISFAVSIGIIVMAINALSLSGIVEKISAITMLMLEMVTIGAIMSHSSISRDEKKTTGPFLSFAISIGVIVAALNAMSLIGLTEKMSAITLLMIEMAIIGKVMASSSIAKNEKKVSAPFLSFAISLGIVVSALNSLKLEGLSERVAALTLVMIELVVATKYISKVESSLGTIGILLSFAISLGIVVKALNSISLEGLVTKLATLGAVMFSLVLVTQYISKVDGAVGSMGILLSFAISLGLVVKAINAIDLSNIAEKITTITAVIAGMVLASKYISKNATDSSKGASVLLAFAASVGILVISLNAMNPANALSKMVVISAMILELTMVSKILSSNGGMVSSGSAAILAFAASIGIIVTAFNNLDVTNAVAKLAVISVIMVELTLVLTILKTLGSTSIMSAITVAAMIGLIMIELVAVFAIMNQFDTDKTLLNAISLSAVLIALSGVMLVLSKVNTNIGESVKAAVALSAFMGVLGLFLVAAGALMNVAGDFVTKGAQLVSLLGSLSPAMLALEIVALGMIAIGAIGAAALPGIVAAAAIIGGLEILLIAIGAIMSIPGAEDFLNKGVSFFGKLGKIIGGFLGNLLGSAFNGFSKMADLPHIALQLSLFMTAIQPFMKGIEAIPTDSLSSVTDFVKTLSALNNIEINPDSISSFTEQLPVFGDAIIAFCDGLREAKVDSELVDSSANAAKALMALNENLPSTGGKLQEFMGQKDLAGFGEQLKLFGQALVDYYAIISAEGSFDADAILSSANAAKALVELNENLPSTGGKLQEFLGQKDLGKFGEQLKTFGSAIVAYNDEIAKGDGISEDAIVSSANAGAALAELASSLEGQGGFLQDIFGSKDLGKFGEQLKTFGSAIKDYATEVDGINVDAVNTSVTAADGLVNLMNSLETSGGVVGFFTGNKSLSDFGVELKDFGSYLKQYSDKLTGTDFGIINESIVALRSLIFQLAKVGDLKGGWSNKLSSALDSVGAEGIDGFTKAISNSKDKLKRFGSEVVLWFITGINSQKHEFSNRGAEVASDFVKAIDRAYSRSKDAGEKLVTGLISGMDGQIPKAESAASKIANALLNTLESVLKIKSPSRRGEQIGKYTVQGLAKGITSNTNISNEAISNAGNELVESIQNTLKIHSPSVVFNEEVGKWIVRGIAEGIKTDMSAEEAAEKKASNIVSAFKAALNRIDLRSALGSAEFGLQQALWPDDMKEEDKISAQVKDLERQMRLQVETIQAMSGTYQAQLETFGEQADATIEAKTNLLKAQTEAVELAKKIEELQNGTAGDADSKTAAYNKFVEELNAGRQQDTFTTQRINEKLQKELSAAEKAINDAAEKNISGEKMDALLAEYTRVETEILENQRKGMTNIERMVSLGWYTEEELIAAAARRTGWDKFENGETTSAEAILKQYFPGIEDFAATIDWSGVSIEIEKATPKVAASAKSMGQSVPKNVAAGVDEAKPEVDDAVDTMVEGLTEGGANAMRGAAKGIRDNSAEVVDATANAAKETKSKWDQLFDSHSPSKEMEKRGLWFIQGFVNGLDGNKQLIFNMVQSIASQIMTYAAPSQAQTTALASSFSATVSKAASMAESSMPNSTFTIRPVLDMTEAEAQLSAFQRESSRMATKVNLEVEDRTGKIQNGSVQPVQIVNNNNYNQTINTPKVATPIEIVRRTKNLMSQIIGGMAGS